MSPFHAKLQDLARQAERPSAHLRSLVKKNTRCSNLFFHGGGLHLDLSRQRLDLPILHTLVDMAREKDLRQQFQSMMQGEYVNISEKRPALHTLARDCDTTVWVEGKNVGQDLFHVQGRVFSFAEALRVGKIKADDGAAFTHILVLGIGGSRLGTQAIHDALAGRHAPAMDLRFLSTVDPNAFLHETRDLDPRRTLVLVVSKSFTTKEVHVNLEQVKTWMQAAHVPASRHLVIITAQGSPGDTGADACLDVFHIFDFIGGRYSASSAVGILPLSLVYGPEVVKEFLAGCREMDMHSAKACESVNLPLLAALCDIWNGDYLGYPAFAMIPYAHPLRSFPSHMQQLYMESLGKELTVSGKPLPASSLAMLCFGDTGTDAQHSFFQMLHQGRGIPIDFIGVLNPPPSLGNHETNPDPHQELWANLLAQADAFAMGRSEGRPEQICPGNRPSSILTLTDLYARDIGRLFAFLEARTVYVGLLKEINPFDQFGVENGKKLADTLVKAMHSSQPGADSGTTPQYLRALRCGGFSGMDSGNKPRACS